MIYYAQDNIQPGLIEDVTCVESLTEKGFYKQNYIDITQIHIGNSPVYLEGQMKFNTCDYFGTRDYNYDDGYYYLQHILTTKLGRRFVAISIGVEDITNY